MSVTESNQGLSRLNYWKSFLEKIRLNIFHALKDVKAHGNLISAYRGMSDLVFAFDKTLFNSPAKTSLLEQYGLLKDLTLYDVFDGSLESIKDVPVRIKEAMEKLTDRDFV